MLLKFQGEIISDYYAFANSTCQYIHGLRRNKDAEPEPKLTSFKIPQESAICIIGNGAVENNSISTALKDNNLYHENILQHAYLYRCIKEHKEYFKTLKYWLQQILIVFSLPAINLNENDLEYHQYIVKQCISITDWILSSPKSSRQDNTLHRKIDELNRLIKTIQDSKLVDIDKTLFLECPIDYLYSGGVFNFVFASELLELTHQYNTFKNSLANTINSVKSSKLRDIPVVIQNDDQFKNNKHFWFISLNWCNSDIDNKLINNHLKLHGSCQEFQSMILPTEELLDNQFMQKNYIHQIAKNLFERCATLYLWGCALHDYDVEIHSLLCMANKIKRIIIINPDEDKKIRERLENLKLIKKWDVIIKHIDPHK